MGVLLLSSALVLSACASLPTGVPASPSATQGTTADPEPVVSERPGSRVPLECGAFEDVAAGAMNVERVLLDEKWVLDNHPEAFAGLQAGKLSCYWESSAAGMWDPPWLGLQIVPDADADFAAQQPPTSPEFEEAGLFGPGSRFTCPEGAGAQCEMSFLVDGYWVFVWLRPVREPAADAPGSRELMLWAGQTIAEVLGAAGPPRAAYAVAPGTLGAWEECSDLEAGGSLASVLDVPTLTPQGVLPEGDRGIGDEIDDAVRHRANLAWCAWETADGSESDIVYASAAILPGGGWVLSELAAPSRYDGVTPVRVEGTDDAVLMCTDARSCDVGALVDGSYLFVHLFFAESARGDRTAPTVAATEHLIAALIASR